MKRTITIIIGLVWSASLLNLRAQGTAFTYQGHVRASGNAFTGTGQFKFALVTSMNISRQATATGTISGGFLTIVNVTDGGQGYVTPPSITAEGGGGSGAVLTANVSGGVVVSISVNNPGSGYVSPPAIVIAPPSEAIVYTTYWSNDGSSVNGSEPSVPVAVPVGNGLFSVLLGNSALANMQEIGGSVFDQTNLQLRIWFNDGVNGFSVLDPAQPLTATPYAIRARFAGGITGTLNSNNLATGAVASAQILDGSVGSSDIADNSIGAADLNVTNFNTTFWRTAGNGGTMAGTHFLGTADNQPLEIKVNNSRVLRLQPDSISPNIIGGHAANFVAAGAYGATIGGGGGGGGGFPQSASNLIQQLTFGTIGGGEGNALLSNADHGVISGGESNTIQINASNATIGGGQQNLVGIASDYAAIGGGRFNTAGAFGATIGGGYLNRIQTNASFSAIAGGEGNAVQTNAAYSSIGGGRFNRSEAASATISGGTNNIIRLGSVAAVISGGGGNGIGTNSLYSSIGGGLFNSVAAYSTGSVVAGGFFNWIETNCFRSVISGGDSNVIEAGASYAAIGGGTRNTNSADNAVIGGGWRNKTLGDQSVIGGGLQNAIFFSADYAMIGGGRGNDVHGSYSIIGGGWENEIELLAYFATIGGGQFNGIHTNADHSTIGGGYNNDIQNLAAFTTIGGGGFNSIHTNADYATIAGGAENDASGDCSVIGGGSNNTTRASFATIPGGVFNSATNFAFAAGRRAKAFHSGSFVWADSQNSDFPSTANDEASFRCQGGVRFSSGAGGANQQVAWTPGSGAWSFTSDRETKEALVPVEGRAVLERVARLPISEWNYKGYAQRHIGPMAQDFHAAFPLNTNDTALNTADLHGVTLAAIQGLNKKLQEQVQTRDTQIGELEKRLRRLELLLDVLVKNPLRQIPLLAQV